MENKKKLIMVVLSVLVCIMAIGYAVLSQQLNINGTASIDSTWRVEITNITDRDIVGDATNKVEPSYTATTANFSVGLTQPTDSITYDIEVSNLGTLDARVGSINVTLDENDAIAYKTTGIKTGDSLKMNEKDTLSITVTYNPEVTSQPSLTTKEITVTINYVQDLGENAPITYDTYSIGDTVTFAGSNWYVIKNSTADEDYVTLLKEKVLTGSELGDYSIYNIISCTDTDVAVGDYECTTVGGPGKQRRDYMPYYWSDTCHISGYYGYTETDSSGCDGHNDYEGSKVKEYLEGTYINTLGTNNLKEVEGYKIRLITTEELSANLGWVDINSTVASYNKNANVPKWVYQNFGENFYWTMTPHTDVSNYVWYVYNNGDLDYTDVYNHFYGVRPVINLLKSSI